MVVLENIDLFFNLQNLGVELRYVVLLETLVDLFVVGEDVTQNHLWFI